MPHILKKSEFLCQVLTRVRSTRNDAKEFVRRNFGKLRTLGATIITQELSQIATMAETDLQRNNILKTSIRNAFSGFLKLEWSVYPCRA